MEHATSSAQPHPHHVCVYPHAYPSKGWIRPPHLTSAYTIISHPHHTTHNPMRDTLPDKQSVPPALSHQRFTIATGNSSLTIWKYKKPSSLRKIPYHFIPPSHRLAVVIDTL